MAIPLSPPSDVRYYRFSDGAILHLEGSHRIWALNSMAAFIWRLLGKSEHIQEAASRYAAAFDLDPQRALADLESALAGFEQQGLFPDSRQNHAPEPEGFEKITPRGPRLVEPPSWVSHNFIETPGHIFEIGCSDAALGAALMHPVAHLGTGPQNRSDTRIAVVAGNQSPKRWNLFVDGRGWQQGLKENEVFPYLAMLIFERACMALDNRLLFHSAVVEKEGRALLLPAETGSGKTTLAAALICRGGRFFSDEIAALNVANLHVSPLPLPLSIKTGSVQPLLPHYPQLADSPVHLRVDGKKVRYLSPPPRHLPPKFQDSVPVQGLVFPRFESNQTTGLHPIDKIEAMQRLSITGSSDRDLIGSDIEAMIALVEQTPCYRLVFSELSAAVDLLEDQGLW